MYNICYESDGEVAQSCPTLCKPMGCSPPGSSVRGILQARTLEWGCHFLLQGSSRPTNWTRLSCIAGRRFTLWATRGSPQISIMPAVNTTYGYIVTLATDAEILRNFSDNLWFHTILGKLPPIILFSTTSCLFRPWRRLLGIEQPDVVCVCAEVCEDHEGWNFSAFFLPSTSPASSKTKSIMSETRPAPAYLSTFFSVFSPPINTSWIFFSKYSLVP